MSGLCGLRGNTPPWRRGYTLAELVVSMGSASLLLIGMASTLAVALRAADPDLAGLRQQQATSTALDQLRRDLQFSTGFVERSPTAAEFTLPRDQDGDGRDDSVRYEWAPFPGSPLRRIYNGGSAVNLIDRLDHLQLNYASATRTVKNPIFRSAELLWLDQVPAGSRDYSVKLLMGIGASFPPPVLPADAVEWTITRVSLQMQSRGAATGVMKAAIYRIGLLNLPGQLIDQVTVKESNLPTSYDWYDIQFPNATGLSPSEGACFTIVFDQLNLSEAAQIRYDDSSTDSPSTSRLQTIDAGLLWTSHAQGDLYMKVWGKYKVGGDTVTQEYNTGVDVQIQPESDLRTRLFTRIPTVNEPLVAP